MTSETSRMTILIFLKKEFLVELFILIYLPAIVVKISPILQKNLNKTIDVKNCKLLKFSHR